MSRTHRHGYWYENDTRYRKPAPRHWQGWQRLCRKVPKIKAMVPHAFDGPVCPYTMTNQQFITLAATLTDPYFRDIFRQVVMDMLADDFKRLFMAHCERMHGWKPQSTQQTN